MTMAKTVPWGIPPEDGIPTILLARYLGIQRNHFGLLLKKLGVRTFYGPPANRPDRRARSQRMLVSEEDAARVIVRVRARAGDRLLRAQKGASATVPGQAAPPGESTAE